VRPKGLAFDTLSLAGDKKQALKTHVADEEIPTLAEIKRVIPAHCFKSNLATSVYYVLRDVVFISLMAYGAYLTHGTKYHYYYLPFYWFFQGFFMWCVFVLGHDCGHGGFSRYKTVNSFFGHLLHSAILVPYHSWRISHRKHHKNTGNYEKDEIFYPMPESEYSGVSALAKFVYKELFFMYPFGFLIYLVKGYGNAMINASHISTKSELFDKNERGMILTSVTCWYSMLAILAGCSYQFGVINVAKYYWAPYLVYCFWLLMVTFLHHTEPGTKWYNTRNWNYVKGNLQSVDRVYGLLEHFHHDIGTHVVHHLFPAIPHYSIRAWSKHHVVPDKTDLFVLPDEN